MPDAFEVARAYLAPNPHSFWRWSENAEVIIWQDNKTLVFRQELEHVLRRLAPRGLPPLGSVLLLLAACRDNWRESASELGILSGIVSHTHRPEPLDAIVSALDGLDHIHMLRPELRYTPAAKAELAEAFFERWQGRTSPEAAAAIVRAVEITPPSQIIQPQDVKSTDAVILLRLQLDCVQHGLRHFDAGAFALRRLTGLDQLVEPADLELAPAERVRALIAKLQDDEELAGLARLARNLMAAVSLPRALADREDLPLGGVSDISNRGSLDRLLLSELAHDDLTLAVRVAVNEALYLRREAPPRTPPHQRLVLIDSGLRMWGVPRVFATAAALAMSATAERHIELGVFHSQGDALADVDLTTRAGLIQHLAALDHAVHPGRALPAVQTALESQDATEAVLVTGEDVWADPDFQVSLADAAIPLWYVATVNREGRLRLLVKTPRGSKLLREAQLDLDGLLAPARKPRMPLIDERQTGPVPAICRALPFPLYLSHNVNADIAWRTGAGVFAVLRDRRLLHWPKATRGASQLSSEGPSGRVFWNADVSDQVCLAVVGALSRQGLSLLRIHLSNGHVETVRLELDEDHPIGVTGHQSFVFVFFQKHINIFVATTGSRIGHFSLTSGMTWRHGRLLQSVTGKWYLFSFDGVSGHLDEALSERTKNCPKLLTLVAPDGHEGCIGVGATFLYRVHESRSVELCWNNGVRVTLGEPEVRAISHDGERVLIQERMSGGRRLIVNARSGEASEVWGGRDGRWDVEFGARGIPDYPVAVHTLRNRFDGIAAYDGGSLLLRSSKGHILQLAYVQNDATLIIRSVDVRGLRLPDIVRFGDGYHLPGAGYTLRRATWLDGSNAFLDSRGLLHLQSADKSIPEMTLVLYEGQTAAWTSDGRRCGPYYFTGDKPEVSAEAIYRNALQPFLARLP